MLTPTSMFLACCHDMHQPTCRHSLQLPPQQMFSTQSVPATWLQPLPECRQDLFSCKWENTEDRGREFPANPQGTSGLAWPAQCKCSNSFHLQRTITSRWSCHRQRKNKGSITVMVLRSNSKLRNNLNNTATVELMKWYDKYQFHLFAFHTKVALLGFSLADWKRGEAASRAPLKATPKLSFMLYEYSTHVEIQNKTLWFKEQLVYALKLFLDQQQLNPVSTCSLSEVETLGCD